jgi:hypothetical protein
MTIGAFIAGLALGYLVRLWLTPSRQDYSKMPRGDERVR